jgi:hypothetical protein
MMTIHNTRALLHHATLMSKALSALSAGSMRLLDAGRKHSEVTRQYKFVGTLQREWLGQLQLGSFPVLVFSKQSSNPPTHPPYPPITARIHSNPLLHVNNSIPPPTHPPYPPLPHSGFLPYPLNPYFILTPSFPRSIPPSN